MKKWIILLLFASAVFSCKKKDPCEELVNGVYLYPQLPKDHQMTREQIDEYIDLPQDISSCISTEGLIETCLNYPELSLIDAGANPQSGYNLLIKQKFLGIRELENRPDRATQLLKKYQSVDPLGYDPNWEGIKIATYAFNLGYLEIFISQYTNLVQLTKNEKITLVELAISVYEKKKNDNINYDVWGQAKTSAILARLMKTDNYPPFINAYTADPNNTAWDVVDYYWSTTFEIEEIIYSLSKEYLNNLKNHNK